MNETTLPRYDVYKQELSGSVSSKARKFCKENCVELISTSGFIRNYNVKPIPGYNKTTYHVTITPTENKCDCQAFVKENKICSHILSVQLYIKTRELKINE